MASGTGTRACCCRQGRPAQGLAVQQDLYADRADQHHRFIVKVLPVGSLSKITDLSAALLLNKPYKEEPMAGAPPPGRFGHCCCSSCCSEALPTFSPALRPRWSPPIRSTLGGLGMSLSLTVGGGGGGLSLSHCQ